MAAAMALSLDAAVATAAGQLRGPPSALRSSRPSWALPSVWRQAAAHARECNTRTRLVWTAARASALSPRDGERADKASRATRPPPDLEGWLGELRARREAQPVRRCGDVYLVGTGPGDPELLTVKALRLLQEADLVLYDRLVSDDILRLVHGGARLLYVGKAASFHTRTQDEIHQLLLAFAEAGATVLRLKGGDPLVFGRGGEEMDFLQERGIRVRIVPGITAAAGIGAELGIPMTHRGVATSVSYLTGHLRVDGGDPLEPLYGGGAAPLEQQTLVIYMGLATLPVTVEGLRRLGLPADTPAVAVERGTTPQQRVVFAHLDSLAARVQNAGLRSPTLIVIGRVVALSPEWPLRGADAGEDEAGSAWDVAAVDGRAWQMGPAAAGGVGVTECRSAEWAATVDPQRTRRWLLPLISPSGEGITR